jgi:hypothetical protein
MLLNNLKSTGVIGPFYERHAHRLSVPVLCVEVWWDFGFLMHKRRVVGRRTGLSQSPQLECEAQRAQSVGRGQAMNKLLLEIAL